MRGLLLPILFVLSFAPFFSTAQEKAQTIYDDTRLFYRSEYSFGPLVHTNGLGGYFRRGFRKTGFIRNHFGVEMLSMRHAKERRIFNPYLEDGSSFIYGKLNSLIILRPTYGRQKVLFGKIAKKGVEVSYVYQAGLSLGFVKPVYLEIADSSLPPFGFITTEKYDPEEHSIEQIQGRASFTRGLDEIRIYPGIHTKFALNFEYAPQDELLRAIEAGIALDAYAKEVPIMAFAENNQFFLTLYLNLQFGKKFL